MSEHICEVVPVKLEKHDNADSLSIARIRGWQCVVRTSDFENVSLGVYIPIDMVIPDTEEWKWLSDRRIKTHKFRGAISQGLLIPAKPGMHEGDDVTEKLGVVRYVPKVPGIRNKMRGGYSIPEPAGMNKYTEIENWKNYTDVFQDGDIVAVTEKIHGANARFALIGNKFFIGSHNTVRMPIPPEPTSWLGKKWIALKRKMEIAPPIRTPDAWQRVAEKYDIEKKMRFAKEFGPNSKFENSKNVILYGEIYGPHVQKLDYGVPSGETRFVAFDISLDGEYMPWDQFKFACASMDIPHVPQIKICEWSPEIMGMVDGKTCLSGNHIREGVVIRPYQEEQYHRKLGRKIIKLISEKYLLKDFEELPEEEL